MKRLFNLDPGEVSLVPRGANRKKFLVFKSLKGNEMPKKDQQDREIRNLIESVSPATMKKVDQVLKTLTAKRVRKDGGDLMPTKDSRTYKEDDGGDMGDGDVEMADDKPLSERAQAALKAMARIAAPFKDELTQKHLSAVAQEVGIGEPAPTEAPDEKTPSDEKLDKGLMDSESPEGIEGEHHAEALAMARKSYGEHLKKLGYRKYPDAEMQQKSKMEACDKDADSDEDDEEEESVGKVNKSALDLSAFPKSQRSQLEMIFKAHQELVQKNEELEAELEKERDHRVSKEFAERARGFKHLGVDSNKLATVLKGLASKDADAYKEIEGILKSADKQIGAGGLFGEIGSRQSGTGDPSNASARLDALVEQVVQKSDGAQTKEQAYDAVLRTAEGKRLYKEYTSARPGGI